MKKQITIVLFIAVLSSTFMSGCGEDSQETTCKTEGFVNCNGKCIDPKTSNLFCGANENCENYEACKATDSCFEGRCRPTKCEADEHFYDVICVTRVLI